MLGQNQAFFYKGQKYKRQKSKREPLLNPDTLRCIKIDESGSYAGTVFLHWKTIVKFRSGEFYVPEGWYVIEDDNRMHSVVSPQVYETFQRGCCNEQRDGICRLSPEREKELSNLAWEMLDGVLNSDLFAHLCEHSDEFRKIRDKLRVLHACVKPLT